MLKYFILFSLFFFSCNKISESPTEQFDVRNSLSENSLSGNSEFSELIYEIKESTQFQELSLLLFEENFVSNTIHDDRISIEQWNQLVDIPNAQQLDGSFPVERINNLLEDNASEFNNYLADFTSAYISLHDEFLVNLTDEQKLEVFLGLFSPSSEYTVTTRESCCAGCEAAYILCSSQNDDNAMVVGGGIMLGGLGAAIYSANPYALLVGVVVGTVVGGVTHAVGGRHCSETRDMCLSHCPEDC